MSADLLSHSPRPAPKPARLRASSSAPVSSRPSSSISDSGSSVSSASSTSSHRNKTLMKTYHDFAMQIFNPGHAHDVENLFLAAARDGDYDRVENFLRRRSHEIVNIDVKEKRTGNTPILLAAKSGHLKIVQLLLKYGADITIRNFDNETAVDVAKPAVRAALLRSVERAGCTPRHLLQAAWQGNIDVVQRLLSESKVLDINCRNADGFTPLLLVTRDVDLFEQIGAALKDYNPKAVVKELLKHRADLTTHDAEGRTPLHFAAASRAQLAEEIAMILMGEPGAVQIRDCRSLAPIHSASQSGQVEILVALLDSGADVNARGYAGATPLHISACSGQLQAATKLLNHGADVTLVDDSGNTPVDVAKTKKLKLTLREAWTEATQAKGDLVLTPVKPPSRLAESRTPSTEDRAFQDSIGTTPRSGSSLNFTAEKRIIRKMTEAHKAIVAEEQMLRDIDSGRFTPSLSPRKLGLPRASSRNGASPGKLPVPPKTPRVLEHTSGTSLGMSPEKTRKAARSLFGGRPRTNTVPGADDTVEFRNQRAQTHAKVTQSNSDPVVSKTACDMSQLPVTIVGLDLDENLRDIRFQRLISGQAPPIQDRRRSRERVDVAVNPMPPSERRPSAGSRGSNPSVHDVTWACTDYIQKGRKYQASLGSSSIISIDDESSTPPPKRVPFRANMLTHPLNLEYLHLSTPSPMLDPTQLLNPASRHALPLSPAHFSENVQQTIFEFDDDEEPNEHPQSHNLRGHSHHLNPKSEQNCEHLKLTRTKSILNHSKPFSIANTRIVDLSKEISTDSGQGSRTTNSLSSSASPLSTPSPLFPRADGESSASKTLVTNRLGVNMTPSATTVKESSLKARTQNTSAKAPSTVTNPTASQKMDTAVASEISLNSARTLVTKSTEKHSKTENTDKSQLARIPEVGEISTRTSKNPVGTQGNKSRKTSLNSVTESVLGKPNTVKKTYATIKLENAVVTKQTNVESKTTKPKRELSSEITVSCPAQEAKVTLDGKKHETVIDSHIKRDAKHETLNKVIHKTAVKEASVTNLKNLNTVVDCHKDDQRLTVKVNHETAVGNQHGKQNSSATRLSLSESSNIKGSNSIRMTINSKSSPSSHSSSKKTSIDEQHVHETAVDKTHSQVFSWIASGPTVGGVLDQCKSAETKLLFGRLSGQGSSKKKVDAQSDQGMQKVDITAKTSVESLKKTASSSQDGVFPKGKLLSQGSKQGKSSSPLKTTKNTTADEQHVHETAVDKTHSQEIAGIKNGQIVQGVLDQCKSAETKLLFGRLSSQQSSKKKVDAQSDQGMQKVDITAKTSVESLKKTASSSQDGVFPNVKLLSQGSKQGKSSLLKTETLKANTPSLNADLVSASGEIPKISPRPGYDQGSKSPAGSTEKASPRIQTSKGGPSLSKSFGSGSSQTKIELRNVVHETKQHKNMTTSTPKQLCSSDEGVGLELEEQTDRLEDDLSEDEKLFQSEKLILHHKITKTRKSYTESSRRRSLEHDANVMEVIPSDKTAGQNGLAKSKKASRHPQSTGSKSDSVESIEEVYEEVVFVSDEEKGESEKSNSKTDMSQDVVKIQMKEVDVVKDAKIVKQKKIVRKTAGRIIPAVKSQAKKDQKAVEKKIGGLSKTILRAVGKSVSEAKLQGKESMVQLPELQPSKTKGRLSTDAAVEKTEAGVAKENLSPKSPNVPKPKTPKFHWSKFRSSDLSPRSDSSLEIHHDPRVIKEHTPIIQDVMECMQMMHLQSEPSSIPWKPREKILSTSSCPAPDRLNTLVKTRRRIASSKEPPRRPSVKGSLRKVAIMGSQKGKGSRPGSRPGSGGKPQQKGKQKGKKKREQDAVSMQKKGKPRVTVKANTKAKLRPDKLHLLSESDSATKAFITGQGWHIQTEKNETSDVIIHDQSALDSSSVSSLEGEVPFGPKLSPHNTLFLNELCKLHPLSPAAINNLANIMSPLEVNTPRYIPDTMDTIKEFGDSLKSNSSSEADQKQQAGSEKKFTFEQKNLERSTMNAGSNRKEIPDSEEICQPGPDDIPVNQISDSSAQVKPEKMTEDSSLGSASSSEGKIKHDGDIGDDSGSVSNTPRIITSEASGSLTERSDASYCNSEDSSSYETNPEFLKVFRLKDPGTPGAPFGSQMLSTFLCKDRDNMTEQTDPPESSSEQNPEHDLASEKISHKPPLPSKTNTTISELTRVPRGSIKRRHSEPPEKASEEKKESSDRAYNVRQFVQVKNSWKEEARAEDRLPGFAEEQREKVRPKWRERNQVEDMVSPLKSRLPDKIFSPPSSSKESPTRRRGNSMPEVVSSARNQDELVKYKKRISEKSQRKPSNYSEESEVFLNDEVLADGADQDDEEDDAIVEELMLTEHVQHMSMSAMQELNTVLSQSGDVHFEFPPPSIRPSSRDTDAESVGFEPDWFNQSMTQSEASEIHNTHSSSLSSERSHSASTNLSESEGGLLHWKKGNILGRGAFGVVFCALTNTGQLIAVKQVELSDKDNKHKSRQQYEKLQEEVELLKTLRHRNIVGFLGVSLEVSTVNIFMQYIPGGSIASLLARFGALDEPVFCRYTKQILQGTEYLHSKNVIHRDIKGANIMLMSNGVIKMIDFGCAKRLCINISQSQNLLKSMRGTPYWMAPEVIMETGHGKKSDMWSIGCTVFEMATRKPPWSDMQPMSAIFAIGSGSGGPVPQLPERFSCFAREFVNTCLTRDQNERPTATQLLTHSFIRKRRERGRDRFETRISSSTMEDANITFKEQVGTEDRSQQVERASRRMDDFS